MHTYLPRATRPDGASLPLRAHSLRRFAFTFFLVLFFATAAQAVVVRGRVTTALGTPVPGARVQLVENGKSIAQDNPLGLTAPSRSVPLMRAGLPCWRRRAVFCPAIGEDFYGRAERRGHTGFGSRNHDGAAGSVGNGDGHSDSAATVDRTGECDSAGRSGAADRRGRGDAADAERHTGADRNERRRDVAVLCAEAIRRRTWC